MKKIKENSSGVISLEASITLPIFILTVMFFYGLIVVFLGQNIVAHSLIQSANSLSLDPFSMERVERNVIEDLYDGGIEDSGNLIEALYGSFYNRTGYFAATERWYESDDGAKLQETVKKRFIAYIAGSASNGRKLSATEINKIADEKLEYAGIVDGIEGMDFSGTSIEGDILTINVKYEQSFVYDFNGLATIPREQSIKVRLWDIGD